MREREEPNPNTRESEEVDLGFLDKSSRRSKSIASKVVGDDPGGPFRCCSHHSKLCRFSDGEREREREAMV